MTSCTDANNGAERDWLDTNTVGVSFSVELRRSAYQLRLHLFNKLTMLAPSQLTSSPEISQAVVCNGVCHSRQSSKH